MYLYGYLVRTASAQKGSLCAVRRKFYEICLEFDIKQVKEMLSCWVRGEGGTLCTKFGGVVRASQKESFFVPVETRTPFLNFLAATGFCK
jgi:hypothetical protein